MRDGVGQGDDLHGPWVFMAMGEVALNYITGREGSAETREEEAAGSKLFIIGINGFECSYGFDGFKWQVEFEEMFARRELGE